MIRADVSQPAEIDVAVPVRGWETTHAPYAEVAVSGAELLALLFMLGIALILAVGFGIHGKSLEETAWMGEAVGGLGAFLFSLVGTAAAVWWFLRRDPLRPRITIEQEALAVVKLGEKRAVQVTTRLENVGEIRVALNRCKVWAYPLDPIPACVQAKIERNGGIIRESREHWMKEDFSGGEVTFREVRIRPGEVQDITFILFVPSTTKVMGIYTFVPHAGLNLSRDENRGWTKRTVLRLSAQGA